LNQLFADTNAVYKCPLISQPKAILKKEKKIWDAVSYCWIGFSERLLLTRSWSFPFLASRATRNYSRRTLFFFKQFANYS